MTLMPAIKKVQSWSDFNMGVNPYYDVHIDLSKIAQNQIIVQKQGYIPNVVK